MCISSNVYDHFKPYFPDPDYFKPWKTDPFDQPYTAPTPMPSPPMSVDELKKLLEDFHEAVKHAKELDRLMKNPDCQDPEKAKLEGRIAELEKKIAELEGKKKAKKAPKAKKKK